MKTTKKDFAIFKKEVNKWVEFFGLKEWRICFEHKKCDLNNANAEVCYDIDNKLATIRLNTAVDDGRLLESAFHEVDELRYAKLREAALQKKKPTLDEMNALVHELINQDSNLIFDKFFPTP